MKRSSFLASIIGIFGFLRFKKKPEEWDYMHAPIKEPEPIKWISHGEITFGETPEYLNEVTISKFPITNKIECSYIVDDKFMVVEYDTETGEKKILRWYNTKDIKA